MNLEEQLEEQEKEMIALKVKVQVLEAGNAQLVEEKKIREKDITSLEEKYQKEIAELQAKLTAQNDAFEDKQKKEMIALKVKVQVLEAGNAQLVEEKKIREKDITSLEENYGKEIAELQAKLTAQNEAFEDKLKKEMIEMKAKVQVLEAENVQLVEEKKIQEEKWIKDIALLEDKYEKEIDELQGKLTAQNEVFKEKLKKLEEMIQTNKEKISETEGEIMVQIREMKEMKDLVPKETWYEVLAFVPRIQLGCAVAQIGNRQFAGIIQPFLHEFGQIKLGRMGITRPHFPSDAMVYVWPNAGTNLPDWAMPGNIKDFKGIYLNYVDATVVHFLGKFQQNSLFTNVNMHFEDTRSLDEDNIVPLLTEIAPFITCIDSMYSLKIDLIKIAYNNNTIYGNRYNLLLREMMAETRILATNWYSFDFDFRYNSWEDKMDRFCTWLYTPRDDGRPRMLRLLPTKIIDYTTHVCALFIERIKKDFKEASRAVSFFIYTQQIWWEENVEEISIDNGETKEKLVIKKMPAVDGNGELLMLMIARHPLKAPKKWIEANEKEIVEWDTEKVERKIILKAGLII